MTAAEPLLSVEDLSVRCRSRTGAPTLVVDRASLVVPSAKVVGLVGDSGAGKTVLAHAILRLLEDATTEGRIVFGGEDLQTLPEQSLRAIRGKHLGMVFQDPMSSLNPVLPVGQQIAQVLRTHEHMDRRAAVRRAGELLELVGVQSREERARAFPHELSGGTRQRVAIAMALACGPRLLIADEPTRALDVTVQAHVLKLLKTLQAEAGMSTLLITHDLGVVAAVCDLVYVMQAGRIVEHGAVGDVFARPQHQATASLLSAMPRAV